MRLSHAVCAALFAAHIMPLHAQTSYISPDGKNRFPGVTVFCPSGTGVVPCNFGGGTGGGAVSINLGTSAVSITNRFPVTDTALDALINGGALQIGGSVAITGTPSVSVGSVSVSNLPSTQAVSGAVSVNLGGSAVAAGNRFPVADSTLDPLLAGGSLPVSGTVSVGNFPSAQTVSGTVGVTALPSLPAGTNSIGSVNLAAGTLGSVTAGGTAGSLGMAVQGIAGGVALPVSGTFYPATQPISAVSLPLPAGAATASAQTAPLAPVAPGAATATQSMVIGCLANTTLPSFTAGQQGAVPCDTSGRLYVVTVPSANNVPGYLQAVSAGGASTYAALNGAASCAATSIKSSSGMVFSYSISNTNGTGVWARLFASATAPSCGSGTPTKRIYVPAGTTVSLSTDLGWVFASGIGLDVTSGSGLDTDTTAVASAGSVLINIDYK